MDTELDHEIFDMIDFDGDACIEDETYSKDHCTEEKLFEVKLSF